MRQILYMILLLCVSCTGRQASNQGRQMQSVVKVRTITMEKSTDMRTRSYVGQAKVSRAITLLSPYPGTVKVLEAGVGEHVSEGDLLAEIYSETIKSAYEASMATLQQAEDGYERATMVYRKGGMTPVKYKEVETDLVRARAAASAASDALTSGMIAAPFEGVISAIFVHQGSEVTLHAPLIRIIDPHSMEIGFSIPEGELSEIHEGMLAAVDIPALNMEGISAEVTTKGVEASPVTHTYECTLKLLQSIDALAPGMVCKVSLGKDMQPNFIVPSRIIQTDRKGRYVWTLEDGIVHKSYVSVGGFSGSGVIVTDGLSDGQQVISEGFSKVSSGMRAEVSSDDTKTL